MAHADADARIRGLGAMARALARSQAPFGILEMAAEEACTAIGAASVSLSRLDPGTITVRTIVNVGDLGPDEVRWPEDETYTLSQFATLPADIDTVRSWIWQTDDPATPPGERALLHRLEKGSALTSPIFVDGRLWGEFYATRHVGEPLFDETDKAVVEVLTAVLAGAISRSLREESLERLAYQDPLTGLFNRRALDEHAEQAFRVPESGSRDVTAVTVDINDLKAVNDSLGHTVGDQLIQSVARTLGKLFDPLLGSLVARVGGDEFTVLVTDHDPSQVVAMADEICARSWNFGTGARVSCGAATTVVSESTVSTPSELFAAADRAQYVAKRAGLSSTVVADDFGLDPV
jgi:diguanylate cyclase (GGDEF)-like protein